MGEIWKDIEGYKGLYQVSNLGRVKSLDRYIPSPRGIGYMKLTGAIRKTHFTSKYENVILCKNNKYKNCYVHKLVAIAFIPNHNKLPQVNHKDENKRNNNVANLEWCDRKYNCNYGTRNERIGNKPSRRKVVCLTTGQVFDYIRQIEAEYSIHHANISACCRGKMKSAGKHPITGEPLKWMYYEDYAKQIDNN